MAGTKVKGVVVRSKDYKEKDKLITLYTLERGLLTCSMRGVRGDKAKLKAGKEIFCFAEYILESTKSYQIVTQVDIIDNFFGLTQNIDTYYEACAILDIIHKIGANTSDPDLFIVMLKSLKSLCYGNVRRYYVVDKFLIHVLEGLGYSFLSGQCSSCKAKLTGQKYFNLEVGEIVCANCRQDINLAISDACFSAMKLLSMTDFENLATLKLGGDGAMEAYRLLSKDFAWRTGHQICEIPA